MRLPSLKRNISGLFILHAVGFVLTFAAIPYLTRVLGVEGWGRLVFVQIIISYLCWMTNWGYYLGGTKSVAASRESSVETNNIFSTIWTSQLLITLVVTAIFALILFNFSFFRADLYLYLSGILVIFGNLMMPLWFLNGLEKIVESSAIQIFVKCLALPLYYFFIDGKDNIHLYFLINGCVAIFVGIAMFIWMRACLKVAYVFPTFKAVVSVTKDNASLFMSTILANINTSIIPYSLGIYAGDQALGVFNIADRMRGAAVQILHPVSHALFPRMGYLMKNDKTAAKLLLQRSGRLLMLFSGLLSFGLFIFAGDIVQLVAGPEFLQATVLLQILAISPLISTAISFLIYQILVPAGLDSIYLRAIAIMTLFSLVLSFPVLVAWGPLGSTSLVILIEIIGLLLLMRLGYKTLIKSFWVV